MLTMGVEQALRKTQLSSSYNNSVGIRRRLRPRHMHHRGRDTLLNGQRFIRSRLFWSKDHRPGLHCAELRSPLTGYTSKVPVNDTDAELLPSIIRTGDPTGNSEDHPTTVQYHGGAELGP